MRCPLVRLAIGLTMRAFRATGPERDELVREAWALLTRIGVE